jgi:ferredoxin
MAKIVQKYDECIGCGTCVALCPKFWEMDEEGKARLKNGKKNQETGDYEVEIKDGGCNRDAAESCPVQIIRLI